MKLEILILSLFILINFDKCQAINTTELEAHVNQISTSFVEILKKYYPMVQLRTTNETETILSAVKEQKPLIKTALRGLDVALEQLSATNFSERLQMSLAKIELYRITEGYNKISGDILLYKAKISNFPEIGQQSQLIADAFAASNITSFEKSINDTDQVIAPLLSKHFHGQKLTENEKIQIDNALKSFVSECTRIRDELFNVYYLEVEKIQREGLELELTQKLDNEKAINLLNFSIDFAHNYWKMLATIVNF